MFLIPGIVVRALLTPFSAAIPIFGRFFFTDTTALLTFDFRVRFALLIWTLTFWICFFAKLLACFALQVTDFFSAVALSLTELIFFLMAFLALFTLLFAFVFSLFHRLPDFFDEDFLLEDFFLLGLFLLVVFVFVFLLVFLEDLLEDFEDFLFVFFVLAFLAFFLSPPGSLPFTGSFSA